MKEIVIVFVLLVVVLFFFGITPADVIGTVALLFNNVPLVKYATIILVVLFIAGSITDNVVKTRR